MRPALPTDQLSALEIEQVQLYLSGHGWSRDSRASSELANAYRYPELDQAGVLVPRSREIADYTERMGDIVELLAAVEKRSPLQVLGDLLIPSGDTLRVQVYAPEATRGLLPLEEGLRLIEGARDLLLASACSVRNAASYFPRQAYSEAVEFLQNCQLAQTERGSFIARIVAPVPPQVDRPQATFLPEDETDFVAREPFARRSTIRLMTALQHVSEAIDTGDLDEILNGVYEGVSSNLCEALGKMEPSGDQSHVKIAMTWSSNRPRVPQRVARSVRFSQSSFGIVKEAGRRLRENADPVRRSVEGLVVSLKADATLLDDFVGTVVLRSQVGGTSARIQVQLNAEDYKRACDAHRDGHTVAVSGVLHREAKFYRLLYPMAFRVNAGNPS
jgi:hypothetical protein